MANVDAFLRDVASIVPEEYECLAYVDAILRDVESIAPEEYKYLEKDEKLLEEIKTTIKNVLDEQQQESKGVSVEEGYIFQSPLKAAAMTKMSHALTAETFEMSISKIDCVNTAKVMRNGKNVFPAIQLKNTADIDFAYGIQMGSIYIELVLLIASCAGIDVSVSEDEVKSMAEEVAKMLADSEVAKAVDTFILSWNDANITDQAKAIWGLLRITFSTSSRILFKTFKLIIANMSWFELIITVVKLVAHIAAAIITGGTAVIGKIKLALEYSGSRVVQKIHNLGDLTQFRNETAEKAQ